MLRAALILAGDSDPTLARRGLSSARQLLSDPGNYRLFPIPPSARPELLTLATHLGDPGHELATRIRAAPPE
jgi:hypothetical protein